MIERLADRSKTSQSIDIKGASLKILQKMGLEEDIRSKATHEEGSSLLNDDGNVIGRVGVTSEGKIGITQEIEIMRGALADILTRAADAFENVTFRNGCTITELRQSEKDVTAVLSDSGKAEDFEVVVGADGLRSKTREMALDVEDRTDCLYAVDQFVTFYSIPAERVISHFRASSTDEKADLYSYDRWMRSDRPAMLC